MIDNRILIPFAMPFLLLGMARAIWWLAGAEWSQPHMVAALSLVFGLIIGAVIMAALFTQEIEIGHIPIWRRK